MTIKLFSRKNRKDNRRSQRPELKVVEGVDLRSRKKEHKKILGYRREMLLSIDPQNSKAPRAY